MSLFRRITDSKLLLAATATLPTTPLEWLVPRQFNLEGIKVRVFGTVNAAAVGSPAFAADGFLRLIDRIRFEAIEGQGGNRTIVDVDGPALADWCRLQFGFLPEGMARTAWNREFDATQVFDMTFNIPFAHPLFPEPIRSRLALPLPFYSSDPKLSIRFATAADLADGSTSDVTFTSVAVQATTYGREMNVAPDDPRLRHIRSELVTIKKEWLATGKQEFEVPQGGLITSIGQINYDQDKHATLGRGQITTAIDTDEWLVDWKSRIIRRQPLPMLQAENEHGAIVFPEAGTIATAPTTGYWQYPDHSYVWDFLSEDTMSDIGALFSVLDVTPETLSGGKCKIINPANDAATNFSKFTIHKLLGRMEDLQDVVTI